MVCIACLLPLFLVPIVNLLPLLFDLIMGRVYRILGWEYRKPERAPAACPYKPNPNSNPHTTQTQIGTGEYNVIGSDVANKALTADDAKLD